MHRSAPRLTRIIAAAAAVPAMLVVVGCSSDSDGGSADSGKDKGGQQQSAAASTSPEAAKTPAVAPAKFAGLPDPCKTISEKTIKELVPEASAAGKAGKSSDTSISGHCAWNSLDDKGVKGSDYRWLDVSLLRYDSQQALGVSGQQRAEENYAKEIDKAKATEGAKNVKTSPASGVGNAATVVNYTLNKTDEDFTYAVVVARTENAVITVSYNGAGYGGAKSPSVEAVTKSAVKAAKEAVAAVADANKGGGAADDKNSPKPSGEPSAKPSEDAANKQ
ncbi:DUF3558 domain-containing protein [Streptomyces sp. MUM 178J]|uniref:DUF3558 domain-containing protein n=1 Tax=Streptomyces sp. MUM 178J TaxID=2791991 RepID=UPI001F04F9C4|nr:DUF3558 domain-containing protein [Streptomyces sp. MUM 178J]WRQ82043.1 DUF3558 domain-containing protein [Streptomyces sp. MUM 178J]